MGIKFKILSVFLVFLGGFNAVAESKLSAIEIIKKEEMNNFGKSFSSKMTMTVDLEGKARIMEVAIWSEGFENSLIKIIKPEKDKNQGNLKVGKNLWQYLPKVDRIVKIPQSMMLQSWMGSDFTNDDLVKGSRLSIDYTLKILKQETQDGKKVIVIEAMPKPEAPVVWGKIIETVTESENAFVKREYFSEKSELVKTLVGTEVKTFQGHSIPTEMIMTNHALGGRKTKIVYKDVVFDGAMAAGFFEQNNLRKPIF